MLKIYIMKMTTVIPHGRVLKGQIYANEGDMLQLILLCVSITTILCDNPFLI
jgi:hypothetical protein